MAGARLPAGRRRFLLPAIQQSSFGGMSRAPVETFLAALPALSR
jgi:hypothetical protein